MYSKEGKIKLETSAHYVPIGKTNIVFYDMDINTADLVFMITRNQRPLEVSDENVDCFLMLKAKDDSYIVDTAHVEDPKNGKVRYTIPKEFLSHDGEVQGQVWIAIHGKEDIITEVEFSFEIKDSLFDHIPAVDKVNYIKTFDDLRKRIEDRVEFIEEAIKNGDDYVAEMENTLTTGKKDLNDTVTQSKKTIEEIANGAVKTVDSTKETATNEMNSQSTKLIDDAKRIVNNTKDSAINEMNEQSEKHIEEASKAKDDVVQAIDQWNFSGVNLLTGTSDEWEEMTFSGWSNSRLDLLLQNTELLVGDTVTFSMEIDNTVDTENDASGLARIVFYDSDGNLLSDFRGNYIETGKIKKSVVSKEIPENTHRISVYKFFKNKSGEPKTLRVRKLVLNRGVHPADWSRNPSEVARQEEVDNKVDQSFADNLIEHDFLELELGFENYNEDKGPTSLQYTRVGPLCYIFGTIRNTNTIEKDSEIVISTLPSHLIITTTGRALCQGSQNNIFLSTASDMNHASFKNQITISRTRIDNGESHSFNNGKWLNINLMCCVEVID